MIISTVMVIQLSGDATYNWVDRSFKNEKHALQYIEDRNAEITPGLLGLYECDSMNYYLEHTILED